MKKAIRLFSCIMCLFVMSSCGGVNQNESQKTSALSQSQKETQSESESSENNSQTMTQSTTETPSADPVADLNSLSTDKVVWGPGTITDHKQPSEPVSLQETFSKYGASWLLSDENSICLTFDEGYENGYTPAILDTLKEKNVKAVFFVTYDFAKENGDLIERIIKEGHTLGNHSYHHYSMDEISDSQAQEEIEYLHNYIKKNYGYEMKYFRFPKGEFSQKSLAIAQNLGYKSIFWSYAYADWDTDNQPDESTAMKNICNSTHGGEIMLLHAVSKTNAAVLGSVIDDIKQQGYKFTVNL